MASWPQFGPEPNSARCGDEAAAEASPTASSRSLLRLVPSQKQIQTTPAVANLYPVPDLPDDAEQTCESPRAESDRRSSAEPAPALGMIERIRGLASPRLLGVRVLVVTIVHDPEDARIRHRQLSALMAAGALVTYAAPFGRYGRLPPAGVRALDVPRARGRRRVAALRSALALVRAEADQQDIVLVHDPELLIALWAIRRTRTNGPVAVPIWDVHEDTAQALVMRDWLPGVVRRPAASLIRRLEHRAEHTVRLVLAEDGYRQRFEASHPVVPNTSFVPAAAPSPPGDRRVVYLGRLTTARGAGELVELGRRLAATPEGPQLELIGPADGDCAEMIQQAANSGWLTYHGFLPNPQALALLDGACAGLSLLHDQPNYAHSRPTKIMEYMACGLPVVTTPNRTSAELVDRAGSGFVVPFDDVDEVERAVRALAEHEDLRLRFAAAGRDSARTSFDWNRDQTDFVEHLAGWAGR